MANQPTQEAPSSDVVEALDMAVELIQEAKGAEGPNGGFVTNHLDAAESHLDRVRIALASTAGDTLKAELDAVKAELDRQYDENVSLIVENERLRAALERAEQDLSCRDGNGHYCPNCDRSGFDTLQAIRAALGSDQ